MCRAWCKKESLVCIGRHGWAYFLSLQNKAAGRHPNESSTGVGKQSGESFVYMYFTAQMY